VALSGHQEGQAKRPLLDGERTPANAKPSNINAGLCFKFFGMQLGKLGVSRQHQRHNSKDDILRVVLRCAVVRLESEGRQAKSGTMEQGKLG
jgi:hypothetical protein